MILDDFPGLRQLDRKKKAQLVSELMDDLTEEVVELPPDLLAAIEERVAFNNAHPELELTMELVAARLRDLKARIAAKRAHG